MKTNELKILEVQQQLCFFLTEDADDDGLVGKLASTLCTHRLRELLLEILFSGTIAFILTVTNNELLCFLVSILLETRMHNSFI